MPANPEDAFLFASLDSKAPLTARKVHIRRLYDVLQLCIHRNDLTRARRTWAILVRCKEINWMSMWATAVHLVGETQNDEVDAFRKIDLLKDMMLHHPEERESLLKELVFRLILSGQHREALDELELYLPSFPYQDNPALHIYAGLLCLYLSQSSEDLSDKPISLSPSLLREAKIHFERAQAIDPTSIVAESFLTKINARFSGNTQENQDSDDEAMYTDVDTTPFSKRKRSMKASTSP